MIYNDNITYNDFFVFLCIFVFFSREYVIKSIVYYI